MWHFILESVAHAIQYVFFFYPSATLMWNRSDMRKIIHPQKKYSNKFIEPEREKKEKRKRLSPNPRIH